MTIEELLARARSRLDRLDPDAAHEAVAAGALLVDIRAGYASSLVAATLRDLGANATDLDGGFQAWREAGLPVQPQGA